MDEFEKKYTFLQFAMFDLSCFILPIAFGRSDLLVATGRLLLPVQVCN